MTWLISAAIKSRLLFVCTDGKCGEAFGKTTVNMCGGFQLLRQRTSARCAPILRNHQLTSTSASHRDGTIGDDCLVR